ncbi:hypothetical protein ACLMJK_001798 [Lecanora helva]
MRKRFHGLKRLKIRQSWNKYNLYNLSRAEIPRTTDRTFFQQKWTAKSLTRAYHGETIREKKWTRMFRRTIRSVVPMDFNALAEQDGSEQAAGRGSGLETPPDSKQRVLPRTPYLNMTYAPTERRLDTAIFRALFASSTRQARQFVTHGYVKVNGKQVFPAIEENESDRTNADAQMIYPGYQLNPGDMFQVEPDRVLLATGAPKDRSERRAGRRLRAHTARKPSKDTVESDKPQKSISPSPPSPTSDSTEPSKTPKDTLKSLLSQAKGLLSDPSESLPAKRKQDLRAFQKAVKRTLARPDALTASSLDKQLEEITARIAPPPQATPSPSPTPPTADTPQLSSAALQAQASTLSPDQLKTLRAALQEARENPVDASKPYATPWRPRAYMSAFAFVPRYLEVHQQVCSAVYLRHPVARPGLAEVPSPYGLEVNSLAHNWYLRRR